MLLDSALFILDKRKFLLGSVADVTISTNNRVGQTYFWYSRQCLGPNCKQSAILMLVHMVAKWSVCGKNAAHRMTVQHMRRANAFVKHFDLTFTFVGKQRLETILATNRAKQAKSGATQQKSFLLYACRACSLYLMMKTLMILPNAKS